MKHTGKRLLSMLLAIVMVLAIAPVSVFAVGDEGTNAGTVDVTLPEGVNADGFGENTVTDGTNYYATLVEALYGIHNTEMNTLYCKPGANVGAMTHGHVCSSLTVYGNGAYVSGGEQEFEIDTYTACQNGFLRSECEGLTDELTLKVIALNGAGAWGERKTDKTVNLIFSDCDNMSRVYITGTTGVNNITLEDCDITGNTAGYVKVYSNANGNIVINNCKFTDVEIPVNLNHKVAGKQTVTVTNCEFTSCGTSKYDYSAPVRVLSSVEGATSELNVTDCKFSGTVANSLGQDADVLLDYAVGKTDFKANGTDAKVAVEYAENAATDVTVSKNETTAIANTAAKIGNVEYTSLAAAFAAAKKGDTVTLCADVTLTEAVKILDADVLKDITLDGNGHTVTLNVGEGGSGFRFGDVKTNIGGDSDIYAQHVTVQNLTIETAKGTTARFGIFFCSGKSMEMTNVTIKGSYVIAGVSFYGSNGGKLTNCNIVKMFSNGSPTNSITLKETKIDEYEINCVDKSGGATDGVKLFADEKSEIKTLVSFADNACNVAPEVLNSGIIGTLKLGIYDEETKEDSYKTVVAIAGGKLYSTLEEALTTQSNIVVLISDVKCDGSVVIPGGVTLDLNGKTLEAKCVAGFGWIIDGKNDMSGLIKVGQSGLMMQGTVENYMPIYTEDGYRFAIIDIQADEDVKFSEDGKSVSFVFRPTLGTTALNQKYLAVDSRDDNGLLVVVSIDWIDGSGNVHEEIIAVSNELLKDIYANDKTISFTLNGINVEVIMISVRVMSDTGVSVNKTVCERGMVE